MLYIPLIIFECKEVGGFGPYFLTEPPQILGTQLKYPYLNMYIEGVKGQAGGKLF